ncbi:MAG TPA: radical SAM protein [Planctomycetota bacterium]|nr:radical SAM protein [Planctomycetota bacterium]OQC21048.1 MAG: Radical SAM superfamily protein [Planctomycetes bacterium ADurb.Bin069]HNR99438.1 radical SAM protein [Planctomycetota bacterium]HNU25978.1 radical SAM protein [Planctomycetota bacterium]HOE30343.1 radical SAM protein [Planctomycetota bacterium]
MRVLLLRPPAGGRRRLFDLGAGRHRYPLHLAYLAAGLRRLGVAVEFLDCPRLDYDAHAAAGAVFTAHPDVVYAELDPRAARAQLIFLAGIKACGSARIVLGGPYASLCARPVLAAFPGLDALILGEPDLALVELVSLWYEGLPAVKVRGVAVPGPTRISEGPPRPLIDDLDSLPFPDRTIVPLAAYQAGCLRRRPVATVAGMRGCPRQCRFCRRGADSRPPRFRNPRAVAQEAEDLIRRHGVREIAFVDPVFNADEDWALALAEAMRPLGATWHCSLAAHAVTAELLESLRRAGCRDVVFNPVCPTRESADALLVRDGPEETRRACALAVNEDVTAHVVVAAGDGELPPLADANAFAASLAGACVTVRRIAPQPGSALLPAPPDDFAAPGEDRDLRLSPAYPFKDPRFWRESVRTLLGRRAEVCARAGIEECGR